MDNIDKLTDRVIDITGKLEAAIGAKGPAMVEAYVSAVWAGAVSNLGTGALLLAGAYFIIRWGSKTLAVGREKWRIFWLPETPPKAPTGDGETAAGVVAILVGIVAGIVGAMAMNAAIGPLLAPTGYALRRLIEG